MSKSYFSSGKLEVTIEKNTVNNAKQPNEKGKAPHFKWLFAMLLLLSFISGQKSFGQTYFTESFESAWYLNGNSATAAIDAGPNSPSGWTQTRVTNSVVPVACTGGAHDWGRSTWSSGTTWSSTSSYPTGCAPYGGAPGSVPAGSKALWFYDGNTNGSSTRRIESPTVDLSASATPVVSFSYSYGGGAVVTLVGSIDGGTTWNTLNTIAATTAGSWVTKVVTIPPSYKIATAKFGFQVVSSYGSYDVFIDNVIIREGLAGTSTSIGGLWSSSATWVGGVIPEVNATIPAGSIVTVDQVISANNLTIAGTVQWNASSNAMTLSGNLTINSTGKLLPYNTGGTGQTINIAGNFQNNGYANLALGTLIFNGSGSTLSGTGIFEGDGTRGIIRTLAFQNLGSNTISTTQNLTVTSGFTHTAGSLNTNGKLKIDNTAQIHGQALNLQVANLVVTVPGSLYTVAPVVFGTAVVQYANALGATLGARYVSGNNVYLCTTAGTFNATAPTSIAATTFATSGPTLIWIGTIGTLGTNVPYNGLLSLTTQYFYGNNVYQSIVTTATTTMPVHTSGVVNNFRYLGTVAKATVNYDSTTQTVRSLNLTQVGSGFTTAPAIAFSVGNVGGTGSGAAATAVLFQSIAGTASSLTSKSGGAATITGGLTINSDQGASVASADVQASSGVGNISTINGGLNYTVAPLVGFAGPATLNLVTNAGSGYTVAPTITFTGGTLVSGTALATANFTITMCQGKVVSVYLNTGTTATYSVPPTLAFSAGTATLAFPSGCWPAATANIGSNGQLTSFTMTNAGFGYAAAPTVGVGTVSATSAGGTFTTVATAPTARIALYNLTLNYFGPATAAVVSSDDAAIPSNRKLNNLSLAGTGMGLNLTNNLILFGTAPLTLTASGNAPGNVLDLGGYNLLCTWNGYAGTTSTFGVNSTYIKNGSMTLTGRGGGTSGSTFTFPFSGSFVTNTGTGVAVTGGADILTVKVTETAAPTNTTTGGTGLAIGTRAFKINTATTLGAAATAGTTPTVTLNYNSVDALTTTQNQTFVSEGMSLNGAWTVRSTSVGSTGALAATGSKATATTAPGPIAYADGSYYIWSSINPSITGVVPTTLCASSGTFTITGTNFTGVSAVKIGGTAVTSFVIASDTSITGLAGVGTTGVVTLTRNGGDTNGSETITVTSSPSAPTVSPASASIILGQASSFTASGGAGTFKWYSAANALLDIGATYAIAANCASSTIYVAEDNGSCEGAKAPVVITVQPTVITASTETFCGTGAANTLSVTPTNGSITYTWTGLNNGTINGAFIGTSIATNAISVTSDYKVEATTSGCPLGVSAFYSVGVYPLPSATLTTTQDGVCPGTSATINTGLSAGNFTSAVIPSTRFTAPGTATTLVSAGVINVTPNLSYGSVGDLDDAGWSNIPIGFTYNFLGVNYTTMSISTNGTVFLGTATDADVSDFAFATLPSTAEPFKMVAVLAMDNNLAGADGGTITYWTEGYYPNRKFIVSYDAVKEFGDTKYSTSQVVFYQTTGIVDVFVTSSSNSDQNKLVGLNNANGTIGVLAYASGTAVTVTPQNPIATAFGYRFSPPSNYNVTWYAGSTVFETAQLNMFSHVVTPAVTTVYSIIYKNALTGCQNAPGSAQVTMNVLGTTAPSGVVTKANTFATSTTICNNGAVALTLDMSTASPLDSTTVGLAYLWYVSTDGGTTYNSVPAATAAAYGPTMTVPSYYKCQIISCGGSATYSTPVYVGFTHTVDSTIAGSRCGTGTIILEATGSAGTTLNWYQTNISTTALLTNNPSFTTPSISTTTDYYVAAENGVCSSARVLVTATVTPAPEFTLSNSTLNLCTGFSTPAVTIATGASSYDTYVVSPLTNVTGNNTTGWVFNPTATTTYTITASQSAGGCSIPVTVAITVNSTNASATATASTVCAGTSLTLNGASTTSGVTYSWSNGSTVEGTTASLVVTPLINTTYTLTVTKTSTSCFAIATPLPIVVNTIPTAPTFTGSSHCGLQVPTAAVVDTNSFTTPTFKWYDAATAGTLLQNFTSTTYTTAISASTNFYVSVMSPQGCESPRTAAIAVTVATPNAITVTPGATATICQGASVSLGATSAGFYTYTWTANTATGSGVSAPLTGASQSVTPTLPGTYVYTVSGTDGLCTTINTVTVTVNANPVITTATATPSTICEGGSATLNGTSVPILAGQVVTGTGTTVNLSYGYPTPFGNEYKGARQQFLFTAAELTSLGLSAGNITSVAYDIVTANEAPLTDYTLSMKSTSVTELTAGFESGLTQVYANASYVPSASAGYDNNTIAFDTPFLWDGTSSIVLEICFWNGAVSTYTTNAIAGYTATLTPRVIYVYNDTVTSCGVAAVYSSLNRSNMKFAGQVSQNLTSSLTWNWATSGSSVGTGSTLVVTPTSTPTTVYTASATNASSCTATQTVTVTVNPKPSVPTTTASTQCGTITPTCSVTSTAGANGSGVYKWYLPSNLVTPIAGQTAINLIGYPVSATTTFSVSEVGANGCDSDKATVTVTVNTPEAVLVSQATATLCLNGSFAPTASSSNTNYVYTWTAIPTVGSGMLSAVTGANPTITPTAAGIYTYTVSGTDGLCTATNTVVATVNALPLISATTATPATICEGGTANLLATTTSIAAGTVTSGTGTTLNTTGTYPTPFGNYYWGAKQQFLFTAAELTALGLSAGPITSVAFDVTTASTTALTNYTIGVMATSATALTTTFETGLSTVYTNASYTPSASLGYVNNAITFSTPFIWNGTSGLVMEICFNNSGFTTNAVVNNTVTSNVSASYYRADAAGVCSTTSATTSSTRPNMKFAGQVATVGAGSLTWGWSPNTALSAVVGNAVTASPTSTTTYTVTATDSNTCVNTATVTLNVNPKPLSLVATNASRCGAGVSTASVSDSNGFTTPTIKWYADAITTTILQTGTATTYLASVPSTTTLYVTVTNPTTSCVSDRIPVVITIDTLPSATINYTGTPFCSDAANASVVFTAGTGVSTGGVYSSTSGLTINGSTGEITIAGSTPGTYLVTYTMNGLTCGNPTATKSITINQAPVSGFTYAAAAYCTSGGTVIPTISGSAGTFTSTAGLTLNGVTGVITPSTSTAGLYIITNTVSVAGCANSVTTAAVTINTEVAISIQPAGLSLLSSDPASFAVTASGTGTLTYQWEVSTNSGASWTALTDAGVYSNTTTSTLAISAVNFGLNGNQYHVIVTGTSPCAPLTSSAATLTVSSIAITTQPAPNQTICSTSSVSFSVVIGGGTPTSYQWESSTNAGGTWTTIGGATASTYTITSGLTSANTGTQYRCLIDDLISNAAVLTVNDVPKFDSVLADQTVCSSSSVTFTANASGSGLTYQWQVSINNGVTYNNVASNGTSATYVITSPTSALTNNLYQVLVSGTAACAITITSAAATLTVNDLVAITSQPTNQVICPTTTATFTVAATGTRLNYQWIATTGLVDTVLTDTTINGATFTGTNTDSLSVATPLSFNGYTFRCVVTGTAPCAAVTSTIVSLTLINAATYTVGSGGNFSNLTTAIAQIKVCGITQATTLELTSAYNATTETYPIVLSAIPGASLSNTITIRQASGVTGKVITSGNALATIEISAGTNWIIDGRSGGVGAMNLQIANTAVTGSAILYRNEASNNTVRYTDIRGVNTSATSGVVAFAGTTGANGNDNNTITYSDIREGATFPTNGIYSAGASGAILNDTNTLSNNNIYNAFNVALSTSAIFIAGNNNAWTVTGNKVFQTATRIYTTAATHYGINITSGAGYTISDNVIGYANTSGTGTTNLVGNSVALTGTFPSAYTTTGTANGTKYVAINAAFTAAGTVSSIQNNTVAGFALYTSIAAATTNGVFCGINVTSGNANIGTVTGNTIGATTGNSSIYVASGTTGAQVVGIYTTSGNTVAIQNNTIGAIDASGTSATTRAGFTGIDTAGAGNYSITNNTIGNADASNIRSGYFLSGGNLTNANGTATSTTGATAFMMGIRSTMTGNVLAITGNTLRGWNTSGTVTPVTGIFSSGTLTGTTPTLDINTNSLGTSSRDFMTYSFATSGALTGISSSSVATTSNVNTNDFRGIVHSVAGTSAHTYLSYTGGTAASNVSNVSNNTFTNLNVNTTGSVTFIAHSYSIAATGTMTLNNNSIVSAFNKGGAGGTVTLDTTSASTANEAIYNQTNNNFSNITVTGATGITGFTNSDGAGTSPTKTITGNTFNNWTGGTSAITAMTFSYWGGASTSLSNNTITNITGQGAITGVSLGSSANLATLLTVSGNTITGLVSTGTGGAVTGITTSNTSTVININGNTINTLSSTGTPVTAIAVTGATATNVYSNTISTLSSSNLSGVVNGISVSGGATVKLYKNKIYDLSESAAITASGAVNGIVMSGGTTVSAYNNVIGNLNAPTANAVDAIRGISVTSTTATTSYNLFNNTINLNASSSGAAFGTTGIYHATSTTATTAVLNLQNNIVINTSTPGTTGVVTALRRSTAGALLNFATTSNLNMYYAGTPAANKTIMTDGTNFYQTQADYYTAVGTTREANSFADANFTYTTVGSFFTSLTGADATYLKPVTAIGTQAESGGGTALSSIFTDDYSGITRPASPGTAYDLGAYEFAGTTPAPVIVFTSATPVLISQCSATSRAIVATITTGSGSSITSATLNYNFNGVAQTALTMTNGGSGDVWTATMLAPSPVNATVTWSITAVNGIPLTTTYTGTSYSDAPLTGATATTTATSIVPCEGFANTLTASLVGPGTVTLGAGAGTSSSAGVSMFPGSWGGAKTQFLIKASELTALGLSAGNITSLAFEATSAFSGYEGFALNIGATALTNLAMPMVTSGLTQVYSGSGTNGLYATTVGVNTLAFSSPFSWDGTSNIILSFCWAKNPVLTSTTGTTVKTDATSPSYTCSLYGQKDSTIASTMCPFSAASDFGTSGTGTSKPKFIFAGTKALAVTTYSWATTAAPGTELGTGSTLAVSPSVNTSYVATLSASGCTIASSPITLTVTPLAVAGTVTAGSSTTVCTGTNSTVLTLASSVGTIQWQSATNLAFTTGLSNIGSATGTTYTVSNISATTYYRARLTSSCNVVYSNIITMTVDPASVAGAITGVAPVCNGTNSTLLTLNGATGTPQWESSTTDATTGFVAIDGATGATYTAIGLATTTWFRAVVTSGVCSSATTPAVQMTVNQNSTAALLSGTASICPTSSTNLQVAITGGTSPFTVVYNNGTSDVTVSSYVSGSNISVSPTADTTYSLVSVTSFGGCAGTNNAATTAVVTIITTAPGSVSGGTSICNGTTSGELTLTGHDNTIVRWESKTATGAWTSIVNTATTYTSGILTETTQFRAVVQNGICAEVPSIATTVTVLANVTYYADTDGDTYGDSAVTSVSCTGAPVGYVLDNTDCDDTNINAHASYPFFADNDGDTYGAGTAVSLCAVNAVTPPLGYAVAGSDCNDGNALIHDSFSFYADNDQDGYGIGSLVAVCAVDALTPPVGYALVGSDCDDLDNTSWRSDTFYADADNDTYTLSTPTTICYGATAPSGYALVASEIIDCNDANGTMHTSYSFYVDSDLDGYGTGTIVTGVCAVDADTAPAGYSVNNSDCAPNDITMHATYSFYADADHDTFGTGELVTSICAVDGLTAPVGYSVNATDCDDADATLYPGSVKSVWIGAFDSTWTDGRNWKCGNVPVAGTPWVFPEPVLPATSAAAIPPTATAIIVIAAGATNQPVLATDLIVNSLTIETGATVIVPTGIDLTVLNAIVNNGTMTVQNNANLIQVNNVANTGNITVVRNSAPLLRLDHTLWSSPVTVNTQELGYQTLQSFSPNTLANRFYTYTTSTNSYTATSASSVFTAGKGYAIRASNLQSAAIASPFAGSFIGVPNNGNKTFTLATTSANNLLDYNLIGNPYPSTIDITAFLAANQNVVGTIYFYSHSLTMNASGVFPQSAAPYGGTNYSKRNETGGVAATTENELFGVHAAPAAPSSSTIQVGQGFLVRSKAPLEGTGGGNITFTNAMRRDSTSTNNSTPFMRTISVDKHRIWLNLKTASGIDINQMMVGYIQGATQGVDFNYDGLEFGTTGSSLSSKLDGANYCIQGRSLPFASNDVVPLGFKASAVGDYTISLTNTDGLFAETQDIFVRDNLIGTDHNIKVSPYTFASDAGTFDSRFELVYTQALGVPSTDFTPNSVIVYKNTDWFHVNTKGITMKEIQVYDVTGRLIYKLSDINATTAVLRGLTETNEVLFLKITSEDNVTVTVKVIN